MRNIRGPTGHYLSLPNAHGNPPGSLWGVFVRRRAAALLAIPILLSGCSPEEDDAPPIDQAVALEVDAPRIIVHNPGTGDRRLFEFAEEAADQRVEVTIASGFRQQTKTKDVGMRPDPVPADETITLSLTANSEGFHAEDTETIAADEEATRSVTVRADNGPAPGFLYGWRATGSGQTTSVRMAAPEGAEDAGRSATEQALLRMTSLPVVLPDKPIAPGAVWSVDSRVAGDATLLQTTTYTLVEADDERLELDVDIEQRPAVGAMDLPDGGKLSVLNSNTASSGHLTVDLAAPLPIAGTVDYTTRVIYGGDSEVRIVQDLLTTVGYGAGAGAGAGAG